MKYALKRDVVWLESIPIVDNIATILVLGVDGHLVAVPAPLLLAVSPLMIEYLVRTSSFCLQSMLFSCHSESINVEQVLDWEVEDFADESVKVETMSIETEYLDNVPPVSQKMRCLSLKLSPQLSVEGTGAFEIKIEPDV